MKLIDREMDGMVFQISSQLEECYVNHGFTTRAGGVSQGIYTSLNLGMGRGDDPKAVEENYRRVCGALELERSKLVFSCQVHGDGVRCVTSADVGKGLDKKVDYEADALVTDIPGVGLTVFGADCITVLFCDPVRRVVAAAHAGWRGTALGIVERVVEKMVGHYGCEASNIRAAIGPGISKCCFETDEDVPNAFTAALGAAALPFLSGGERGKFFVDLKGLNALRLERAGVLREHVDISEDCTLCKPDKYWSHRYTKGERGSQAALIALK